MYGFLTLHLTTILVESNVEAEQMCNVYLSESFIADIFFHLRYVVSLTIITKKVYWQFSFCFNSRMLCSNLPVTP